MFPSDLPMELPSLMSTVVAESHGMVQVSLLDIQL
jgi:hypothetical protein